MNTPETKKTIECRTIEELSKENKLLIEKIKQNSIALHIKKMNEKQEKNEKVLEELLPKMRKTFCFHILSQEKINFVNIRQFIEEIFKKTGKNISKFIIINNFIYVKSKENLIIADRTMGITETCKLEQVNPKDIIKLQ